MKRLLSLVLAFLVLSLAVIPHTVFAESSSENGCTGEVSNRTIIPSNLTLAAGQNVTYSNVGDEVTIPLKLSGIPSKGVACFSTTVFHDNTVLQFISAEAGPIIKKASQNFNLTPRYGGVSLTFFDEESGPNLITDDGVYATLKFKVIKNILTESAIKLTDSGADILENNDFKEISLSVTNGTVKRANIITPIKTVFDMNNPNDVIVTIAEGESLADIKAGSASLVKGNDYIVSGNTVKIAKSYYQYLFSKWPAAASTLTFTMVSGKTDTLVTSIGNSLIIPAKAVFDMKNPSNITVTMSDNETLYDIKAGSASLINGTDYIVSGKTIKINKNYYQYIFSKWPTTTSVLTLTMNSGNAATLTTTLLTTTGTQLITPNKVTFDVGNPKGVNITIADGETLADIKAGSASLIKGTDYTVSGNTVTILNYFNYIFITWPNTVCNLTFVMKSGNNAILTATPDTAGTELITPNKTVFTAGSRESVEITIANGEELADIKAGSVSLVKDIDYNIYYTADSNSSANSRVAHVRILNYFNYIFSKWPNVVCNLTFVMKSGKTCILSVTARNSITPAAITIKKGIATDQIISFMPDKRIVTSITNNGYTLKKDTDYTLSGSSIVLKADYLNTLTCNASLTFNFNHGNSTSLAITLIKLQPQLVPSSEVFYLDWPEDILINVKDDGLKLTSITSGSTLREGFDYTYADGVVKLNKSYLSSLIGAETNSCYIGFTFNFMGQNLVYNLSMCRTKPLEAISVDIGAPEDKAIKIAATDATTISSITNGVYTLKEDIDYTFRKYTGYYLVTLKGNYLSNLTYNTSLVFNLSSKKKLNLPVTVYNSKSFRITLGSASAKKGSIVKIPVIINSIPPAGLAGLQFTAQFDPKYIEAVEYEAGPVCTNPSKNLCVTIENNKIQVLFIDDTAGDQLLKNEGVLVNLNLTLKKDLQGLNNSTNVEIWSSLASDIDFNVYPTTLVDSKITIY